MDHLWRHPPGLACLERSIRAGHAWGRRIIPLAGRLTLADAILKNPAPTGSIGASHEVSSPTALAGDAALSEAASHGRSRFGGWDTRAGPAIFRSCARGARVRALAVFHLAGFFQDPCHHSKPASIAGHSSPLLDRFGRRCTATRDRSRRLIGRRETQCALKHPMALMGLRPSQFCSCSRVACSLLATPSPPAICLNVLLDGFYRGIGRQYATRHTPISAPDIATTVARSTALSRRGYAAMWRRAGGASAATNTYGDGRSRTFRSASGLWPRDQSVPVTVSARLFGRHDAGRANTALGFRPLSGIWISAAQH